MEVKIGVQYAQRELVLESAQTQAEVEQAVTEAMAKDGVLTLTDEKGRKVRRTLGIASLGGATLDNEENYLIKKLFTAAGAVQIENQARI